MAAAALFYFILQVGGDAAVAGRLATRSTLIGGKHYHPSVPDCTPFYTVLGGRGFGGFIALASLFTR